MITKVNTKKELHDATMDDDGETYSTPFEYQVMGDVELYGADEWRCGRVVWQTTTEWRDCVNREQRLMDEEFAVHSEFSERETVDLLQDESEACDWFEFELEDEDGDSVICPDVVEEIQSLV